jgi:hypothetical protein
MKINFIVPEIVRSGGIRVIFEYANRLTERGHEVTLFTPIVPFNIYKGKAVPHYIKYRIKYALKYISGKNLIPSNIFERKFKIKFVPSIKNYFIPDADVVAATAWQTADSVNKLKKSKGKEFYLIQDYEIWYGNPDKINESYKLPLNRIVISEYLHKLLKQKFNVDSCKIPIGIEFDKFQNNNKVYNTPRTILFTDHALENKNTAGAVKIIEKIKNKYPQVRVMCFGLSRFHKMPDYVEFYENPDEDTIVKLYCDSDIFLFTSNYEGFGLPPAEAMACRCAVIGNAVGALPEYAVHNETAILTNPDKPEELYNGVLRLLDNEIELKRISEAGFAHVKKTLNWDRVLDKFEELISKVN